MCTARREAEISEKEEYTSVHNKKQQKLLRNLSQAAITSTAAPRKFHTETGNEIGWKKAKPYLVV